MEPKWISVAERKVAAIEIRTNQAVTNPSTGFKPQEILVVF